VSFYLGANMPWVDGRYGWSFGRHLEWGKGYDGQWVSTFVRALDDAVAKDAGLGILARVFVFGDLRGGVTADADGVFTALPPDTLADIKDMLDRAAATRVKMVLSLLDFHTCDERCATIWDDARLRALMDNVIVPLLTEIATHTAVYGVECMNEPEWAIQETGRAFTPQKMGLWNAQRFCAMVNAEVHRRTPFLTVCGSGSAMWSSYWTDAALRDAYPEGGDDTAFDIMMSHMYSFAAPDYDVFSKPAAQFSNGKPFIIGETGKDDPLDYAAKLRQACALGYVGLLPWSYAANDTVARWADFEPALRAFRGCAA
jgi:hypothetical protein